ncbi:MAG: GTPase domain-containing protein [Gemmataceae bacterium]
MENFRALTNQVAEDLGWLEEHCLKKGDKSGQSAQLRLSAALVRNCIGPYLDGQPAKPLHVSVLGGAGAGKSTVSNMLVGAPVAEANPQAGFTRHPIAYTSTEGASSWAGHLGFLGKLQRLAQPTASSMDSDVYQVRSVHVDGSLPTILNKYVVWDCPDMTTYAALGYVSRLLEVAGLSDVIVYVASDERYNDEVPTRFLKLLLEAGKPVVCVLTKMREAEAPAFLAHFQKDVLSKMPPGNPLCVAIPSLPKAALEDPARQAAKYRIPILNQVNVLGEPLADARRRSVRHAMAYLLSQQENLVAVARHDVNALQSWRTIVQSGQVEFENRYRREYLAGERFRRFDEALVRLLELLELPGVGKSLSQALYVVRTPFRLLKGLVTKQLARPEAPPIPEQPVLEGALSSWLDMLRKEATQRANTHPLWAHVEKGFQGGLNDKARERFQQSLRTFQQAQGEEIERTARQIYEDLEKNPVALNTLRGSKFALDAAAVLAALAMGGINVWDIVLVPLMASVTHQLVELMGARYVDNQREAARERQAELVKQHVAIPLGEFLAQWPATGGSSYERLQSALKRIPSGLQQLNEAVTKALAAK